MFLWKWKMQFLQTWRKFFTRSSKKLCEFTNFFNKNFFPKVFLWKCRIWFWQSCRNFLPERRKCFWTYSPFSNWMFRPKTFLWKKECKIPKPVEIFIPKRAEKLWTYSFFFRQMCSPFFFFWIYGKQFWRSCQKFFTRRLKKKLWFCKFLQIKNFSQYLPLENEKAVLTKLPNFFNRSSKENFEPLTVSKESFPQRNSSEYIESSFDNPAQKFSFEARRTLMNF